MEEAGSPQPVRLPVVQLMPVEEGDDKESEFAHGCEHWSSGLHAEGGPGRNRGA